MEGTMETAVADYICNGKEMSQNLFQGFLTT